jgi:hypothetical protein
MEWQSPWGNHCRGSVRRDARPSLFFAGDWNGPVFNRRLTQMNADSKGERPGLHPRSSRSITTGSVLRLSGFPLMRENCFERLTRARPRRDFLHQKNLRKSVERSECAKSDQCALINCQRMRMNRPSIDRNGSTAKKRTIGFPNPVTRASGLSISAMAGPANHKLHH